MTEPKRTHSWPSPHVVGVQKCLNCDCERFGVRYRGYQGLPVRRIWYRYPNDQSHSTRAPSCLAVTSNLESQVRAYIRSELRNG